MDTPTEQDCQRFLANPGIHPRTGKKMYKTGKFYKMLVQICQKKNKTPTPEKVSLPEFTKKELNAMAKGIITGYTKMSREELITALQEKLRPMNVTLEERYRQLFGKQQQEQFVKPVSKQPTKEKRQPSNKRRSPTEILQGARKIKLTMEKEENNPDILKVKVDTDIAKTKGMVPTKNIKRTLDVFFADRVDKNSLLTIVNQDNYVILYSVTNMGIRFHIPTMLDEVDYNRLKYKNLPFDIAKPLVLDENLDKHYVLYYRLTKDEINRVADYDIFDMAYVRMMEPSPIKDILEKIYKEINKEIRSV